MSELVHATALAVGETGILIRGPSGSGKTTLALAVIEAARLAGRFAILIADDYVSLEACGGRLVATVPARIAGLVERRWLGIVPVAHEAAAVAVLVADLLPPADCERVPDEAAGEATVLGVAIRRIAVPVGVASAAALVLAAVDRMECRSTAEPGHRQFYLHSTTA